MTPAPTQARPTPSSPAQRRQARRRRLQRQRAVRRRRAVAVLLGLAMFGLVVLVSFWLGSTHLRRAPATTSARSAAPAVARAPFAIAEQDVTWVDASRFEALRDGTREPRRLVTRVLYPHASAGRRLPGPFPLVVFGHGYALAPGDYWPLLTAWARAGYVVAAPLFPLEQSGAPGGPEASDLSNQPGDMSFVITRLLAQSASPGTPLHGLVDGAEIAVAGHADGADSARSVAEGSDRDQRVAAAIVLAGAEIPGSSLDPDGGPPLLAVQGTADPVNQPAFTDEYFTALPAPKFLLHLLGASHTSPFTRQQPQVAVVTATTLAFLDRYLKNDAAASARLARVAGMSGVAQLTSDP